MLRKSLRYALLPRTIDVLVSVVHVMSGVASRVLHFSHGILYFTLGLFRCPLHLLFVVVRPIANLTLDATTDVLYFALDTIFIHDFPSVIRFLNDAVTVREQLEDQSQHR
jgi:hypothetical protein